MTAPFAGAQLRMVKGIDLSPGEIEEARKRFTELKLQQPGTPFKGPVQGGPSPHKRMLLSGSKCKTLELNGVAGSR